MWVKIEFINTAFHQRAGYDIGWIFESEYSQLEFGVFFLPDWLPNRE